MAHNTLSVEQTHYIHVFRVPKWCAANLDMRRVHWQMATGDFIASIELSIWIAMGMRQHFWIVSIILQGTVLVTGMSYNAPRVSMHNLFVMSALYSIFHIRLIFYIPYTNIMLCYNYSLNNRSHTSCTRSQVFQLLVWTSWSLYKQWMGNSLRWLFWFSRCTSSMWTAGI